MSHVPAEKIDLAISSIHFHDWSDERDEMITNVLDVWALIDGQPVRELHQGRRRAGLRRVDRARDVVDRRRLPHDLGGARVVHA